MTTDKFKPVAVPPTDEEGQFLVNLKPGKWFRVYGIPDSLSEYSLVDIHIRRGDEDICAKQDLSIPLLDADIVSIGHLHVDPPAA